MNPLELIAFVESNIPEAEQLNALALLADAPEEDFKALMRLPVTNDLPAFHIGPEGLGSSLVGANYGVAAPLPGQEPVAAEPSIGELLVGEING